MDAGRYNGEYRTAAGSVVEISGKNGGRVSVSFEWCEEQNACMDCNPILDGDPLRLIWECEECGGGWAALTKVTPNAGDNRHPHGVRLID